MKNVKKILLWELPAAVESALRQQVENFDKYVISSSLDLQDIASRDTQDIIILQGGKDLSLFKGCPVLALPPNMPLRLGGVLRQIEQILRQPALYLEDMNIGEYVFKPQEKLLSHQSREDISLTDREVDILVYLAKYQGLPVTRDALLWNVWQYQEGIDTHTLETHIYRLRQKLETVAEEPKILLTTDGGYRLQCDEEKMR
jgi:DNA-binding winged helix-turn-helix (wHTH) protein